MEQIVATPADAIEFAAITEIWRVGGEDIMSCPGCLLNEAFRPPVKNKGTMEAFQISEETELHSWGGRENFFQCAVFVESKSVIRIQQEVYFRGAAKGREMLDI